MKYGLLLFALAGTLTAFTQVRLTGTLFGGAAYNHTSHAMVKFGGEMDVVLPSGVFIGASAQWGLNGKYTVARNVIGNSTYALIVGREQQINDHFAVRPYIGLGYQRSIQTNYRYNDSLNAALELANTAATLTTGESLDIEKRYKGERYSTLGVPVGVDFIIGKRGIGITAGYYLFVSNYTETGIRIGLTFGKIH